MRTGLDCIAEMQFFYETMAKVVPVTSYDFGYINKKIRNYKHN